ncbi:MAG: hypothetical protein KDJ87_21025 [Rhizobiaceae bacterium]|nr:hypothetical protein [Rhizobiaceae bacterium]
MILRHRREPGSATTPCPDDRFRRIPWTDSNIDPVWDALLGENTEKAVIRLVGLVLAFVVLGGTVFWLAC